MAIIRKGDAYALPVIIMADDTPITDADVAGVRIGLGTITAIWPDGQLRYDSGVWLLPITQAQSYTLPQGDVYYQAQVQLPSGETLSSPRAKIHIDSSIFRQPWGKRELDVDGSVAASAVTASVSLHPESIAAEIENPGVVYGRDAVKYTPQELTDEQKQQARENIGADNQMLVRFTSLGSGKYSADKSIAEIVAAAETGQDVIGATAGTITNVYHLTLFKAGSATFTMASHDALFGVTLYKMTGTVNAAGEDEWAFSFGTQPVRKASSTALGSVKADAKTDDDTVPARIDADGKLWVKGQVQADWQQNDPSQDDYVASRPGGYYHEQTGAQTITWDGDITGKPKVEIPMFFIALEYYKVSDATPTREQLIGGTLETTGDGTTTEQPILNENPYVSNSNSIVESNGFLTISAAGAPAVMIAYKPNAGWSETETDPALRFPEAGTYFLRLSGDDGISYISKLQTVAVGDIVKIPSKFLELLTPTPTAEDAEKILKVGADGSYELAALPKPVFLVTATSSDGATGTADKTALEVKDAIDAGYSVVMKLTMSGADYYLSLAQDLSNIDIVAYAFSCIAVDGTGTAQMNLGAVVAMNGAVIIKKTIMPTPAASDAGKILTVDASGNYTLAELPKYDGGVS